MKMQALTSTEAECRLRGLMLTLRDEMAAKAAAESSSSLGFGIAAEPQGAFYVYADVSALADDSEALARRMIEEAGVAATPGLDFGHHLPRRHLRIAYTTHGARLLEAAERIRRLGLGS